MMLHHPGVGVVHDRHIWALGLEQPILTAHVVVNDGVRGSEPLRRALWRLAMSSASNMQRCR